MTPTPTCHRYTLKKDGRYYTGCGASRGFFARGIAGCYAFNLEQIRTLQAMSGGEIVEVIREEIPTPGGAMQVTFREGRTIA